MGRPQTISLESFPWETGEDTQACEHAGCAEVGLYRAPKGRSDLKNYFWFCLDHVRHYNLQWNFFADMNLDEVEVHTRNDTIGWRPSWPLGQRMASANPYAWDNISDPFGFREEAGRNPDGSQAGKGRKNKAQETGPETAEERALILLDLDGMPSLATLKRRYKELVKRHHPDANGGDKASEEKLKLINQAYEVLKSTL